MALAPPALQGARCSRGVGHSSAPVAPERAASMNADPLSRDPRRPLPGEVTAARRAIFHLVAGGVILLGLGIMIGLALAPESPRETKQRMAELETELTLAKQRVLDLDRAARYKASSDVVRPTGRLRPED